MFAWPTSDSDLHAPLRVSVSRETRVDYPCLANPYLGHLSDSFFRRRALLGSGTDWPKMLGSLKKMGRQWDLQAEGGSNVVLSLAGCTSTRLYPVVGASFSPRRAMWFQP